MRKISLICTRNECTSTEREINVRRLNRHQLVECSMEDTFKRHRQTLAKPQSLTTETTATAITNDSSAVEAYISDENGDLSIEEGNSEMWNNFSNRFRQVQSVLDRNRLLIHQVNENHQSRTNDTMVQNVGLIQELNGNISKVVSLYSDISTNFSTMFGQESNAIGNETNQRHH